MHADNTVTRGVEHFRRQPWAIAAGLIAMALLVPGSAFAADTAAQPASELSEVTRAFESALALPDAERIAALESLDLRVAALMHRDSDAGRVGAQFLSAALATELGRYDRAEDAYRKAARAGENGPFEDDAEFAAIRSLEARGGDVEAAREWPKWEKRHPKSPLLDEARLARAWNALRRGEHREALDIVNALAKGAPWKASDPRLALTRATARYLAGQPKEALEALGPRPIGAPATFLAGLCQGADGSLLRAAAAFQEVADRYPSSPLRDAALLAKADAFLKAHDPRSAATEFARAADRIVDPALKAEAELRGAGASFLAGHTDSALTLFESLVDRHAGTDVAARAQFLVGEALAAQGKQAEAIVAYNRVLTSYFRHAVAASAQYRVARCLDALGRGTDATGSYEAVVRGYALSPEAPAAAYLAGLGFMKQGRPLLAAPYFQLVLDRYAARNDARGFVVFASPEHQELVEAALCLLEYAYHRAGNLGQLSGAPHVLLQHMPPSRSAWRAYALLIDADASASQARYPEAQASLESLMRDFPDHAVGASATKLLAWTYARQGRDSLAIATEERLLARHGAGDQDALVSGALLDIAHVRFNQKRYKTAAAGYEDFLRRFPGHPRRLTALYQAGLCYLRLDQAGDAVDRWMTITRDSSGAAIAERAWARAGDVYFQAEHYEDAQRCYEGLLEHFPDTDAASRAMLRLGQCAYNAGRDGQALERFSATLERFPGTPAAREAQRGTELALYRLSQSPNGSKELARLIEQFPSSAFAADAQFQLARRAMAEKRWGDAAEAFRRVVSQFPSYSGGDHAQFMLAEALTNAKQPEEARLAYEQFLSFFPQSELRPTVQFRLGLMDFERKDYARAAVAFTLVLGDSVSSDVAGASRYNLALCQRMLGRPDDALAELERYRAEHPGDKRAAEVAYQLGDLHDAAGRTAEAEREFELALAAGASARLTTEIEYRLGHSREQHGDAAAALRAYQRAAASADRDDPFRLSAVARSAALFEAKGDVAHALEAYRDLIRNASDRELVAAATDRVSQLQAGRRH